MDDAGLIADFHSGRDPERLALKLALMRQDAFAFFRGTSPLFYQVLSEMSLPETPLVWSCGDLHLENFGSYKGENRLTYFDVNDFDEACLLPAAGDLLRLLTSIYLSAPLLKLDEDEVQAAGGVLLRAYCQALAAGKPGWIERDTAHGPVKDLLKKVAERRRKDFLESRTTLKGKTRRLIIDGRKTLAATEAHQAMVREALGRWAEGTERPAFFQVVDVARRIAGNGSLGLNRFVVLVEGKGSPDDNYLIDLKPAIAAQPIRFFPNPQPAWPTEAHRVAAIERQFQAVAQAYLSPIDLAGQAALLRELQPSADKIAIRDLSPKDLASLLTDIGRLTAWGHLRGGGRRGAALPDELMAFGERDDWVSVLIGLAKQAAGRTTLSWQTFLRR